MPCSSGYEDEVLQNEEMDLLRYMQETADHELQDAFLQNDSREDFSFVDEEERMIGMHKTSRPRFIKRKWKFSID